MSGYGGATPNGMRIGPVYTPPEQRGRGYATTLVAGAERVAARARPPLCFLYTDLANPTSNAIYRRIGYQMVAEAGEFRFDPQERRLAIQQSAVARAHPRVGTTTNAISPGFTMPRHSPREPLENVVIVAAARARAASASFLPLQDGGLRVRARAAPPAARGTTRAGATERTSTPIDDGRAAIVARAVSGARGVDAGLCLDVRLVAGRAAGEVAVMAHGLSAACHPASPAPA